MNLSPFASVLLGGALITAAPLSAQAVSTAPPVAAPGPSFQVTLIDNSPTGPKSYALPAVDTLKIHRFPTPPAGTLAPNPNTLSLVLPGDDRVLIAKLRNALANAHDVQAVIQFTSPSGAPASGPGVAVPAVNTTVTLDGITWIDTNRNHVGDPDWDPLDDFWTERIEVTFTTLLPPSSASPAPAPYSTPD